MTDGDDRRWQRRQQSRNLGELTTLEVDESKLRVLLLPLGSTEQHGPHLPLDTDTRLAVAWCEVLAANDPEAVIAPPLPYGSSGEHQAFSGTLSIGQAALETLLIELARSAGTHFGRVVFVSGHAGNAEPLSRAVGVLRTEGHDVAGLIPTLAGADAHAGRTETSLMLHLHPEAVRTDRLEQGCTTPLPELMPKLVAEGVLAVSVNGVLGDPTGASAAQGRELLRQLASASIDEQARC